MAWESAQVAARHAPFAATGHLHRLQSTAEVEVDQEISLISDGIRQVV
jgi:hypothetical protein